MANLRFKKEWDRISESDATPESVYWNRRQLLGRLGFSGLGLGAYMAAQASLVAASIFSPDSSGVPEYWIRKWADLFPAVRNSDFVVEREVTPEKLVTGFNNFYEFSLIKERVREMVEGFETRPWEVEIRGEVENPGTFDLDDLIRIGNLEERLYHFRCVEAWSANVPWTGYPLAQLIRHVKPSSKARYVRFVSVYRPDQMPGQKNRQYPWPYYEALTLEEAINDLSLLTFGIYGHPLNKQNGAPVRIIVPWKFGFKNIKSIVTIEFTSKRPSTLWDDVSSEYGFWANIHPGFDHPRWSQATEQFLNSGERIPTRIYNGYGRFVAHLYDEKDRKYFF